MKSITKQPQGFLKWKAAHRAGRYSEICIENLDGIGSILSILAKPVIQEMRKHLLRTMLRYATVCYNMLRKMCSRSRPGYQGSFLSPDRRVDDRMTEYT